MAYGLILTSALLHAVWNAYLKKADDRFAAMQFMSVFTFLVGAPFLLVVDPPNGYLWWLIGASILTHIAYQLSIIAMMKEGDYSLVYPIARGLGPVVVTLISISFLGSSIKAAEIAAIVAIVAGAVGAGLAGVKIDHAPPIKAALLAALCGVVIGSYTLIDGWGMKLSPNAGTFIIWSMVTYAPCFLILGYRQRGWSLLASFKAGFWGYLRISIIATTGFILALYAYRLGEIAPLAAMRETSIVFAIVIGTLFLKEKLIPARLVALIIIACGAIALPFYR